MKLFNFDVEKYLIERKFYRKVFLGVPFLLSRENGLSYFEHFSKDVNKFDDCIFEEEDTPFFLPEIEFKKNGETLCLFSEKQRDCLNYKIGATGELGVLVKIGHDHIIKFDETLYINYSKDFSEYKTNLPFYSRFDLKLEEPNERLKRLMKRPYKRIEFKDKLFEFDTENNYYKEILYF